MKREAVSWPFCCLTTELKAFEAAVKATEEKNAVMVKGRETLNAPSAEFITHIDKIIAAQHGLLDVEVKAAAADKLIERHHKLTRRRIASRCRR